MKTLTVYKCPLCKTSWSRGEGATPTDSDFAHAKEKVCFSCENTPIKDEEIFPEFGYGADY